VGRDIEHFMTVFREAGFSQVKRWHQAANHCVRDGHALLNFSRGLQTLDQQEREAVRMTYDDLSGANTPDLKFFEVLVILAFKD